MKNFGLTCLICFAFVMTSISQDRIPGKRESEYGGVYEIYNNSSLSLPKRRNILDSLLNEYRIASDTCGIIKAMNYKSIIFDLMGDLDSAMTYLLWVQSHFASACDSTDILECYSFMSAVQISFSEFEKADSLSNVGLSLWNHSWTSIASSRRVYFNLLTNKAIANASLGDLTDAEKAFADINTMASQYKDSLHFEKSFVNLGTLCALTGRYTDALNYFSEALSSAKSRNYIPILVDTYLNLSGVHQDLGEYKIALQYLDSCEKYMSVSNLQMQSQLNKSYAFLHNKMGDYKKAYEYQLKFQLITDSLFSMEKVNAITDVQEKYESAQKGRQIDELTLQKLNVELSNVRISRARNAMYAGAGLLLCAVLFLINRYRIISRNRNLLQQKNDMIQIERQRSDELLKNILPFEVAEELIVSGKATAKEFECATILFTDFKEFTMHAEKLTAADLVSELDACFRAFDGIVGKYGLEKIKTIGDAYMAVCGLPDKRMHVPENAIYAALEMQAFIMDRSRQFAKSGLTTFEMRAGIHSGSVVAGVVGERKFQYDVWGDTVNIAARMESSGDVGRVNISDATYELVKGIPDLQFESRGEVIAKNKGVMKMYYVARSLASTRSELLKTIQSDDL